MSYENSYKINFSVVNSGREAFWEFRLPPSSRNKNKKIKNNKINFKHSHSVILPYVP